MSKIESANTDQIQGEITIDAQKRVVTIAQKANRFALKPDTVVVQFDTLKMLGAQAVLIDAGMIQVGPPGVVGQGQGTEATPGAAVLAVTH
jgi:hypothetical protein